MDELNNVVILNDQDGNPVPFEFLDLIEYEGNEYVVLLPAEPTEEEEGQLVILRLEATDDDSDEKTYVSVDNEETLMTIFNLFKEKFADEFTFPEE